MECKSADGFGRRSSGLRLKYITAGETKRRDEDSVGYFACGFCRGTNHTSASNDAFDRLPGLDKYRASQIATYVNDYGQLARYRDANAAFQPPAANENRLSSLAIRSPTFGSSMTRFPANTTSIAELAARLLRRCWCAFARM